MHKNINWLTSGYLGPWMSIKLTNNCQKWALCYLWLHFFIFLWMPRYYSCIVTKILMRNMYYPTFEYSRPWISMKIIKIGTKLLKKAFYRFNIIFLLCSVKYWSYFIIRLQMWCMYWQTSMYFWCWMSINFQNWKKIAKNVHFTIFKCLSEDHHYMKSVSCVIFPDPLGPLPRAAESHTLCTRSFPSIYKAIPAYRRGLRKEDGRKNRCDSGNRFPMPHLNREYANVG